MHHLLAWWHALRVHHRGELGDRRTSMESPEMGEGVAPGLKDRRPMIAVLASAGIAAPVIFSVVAIVHSLLREDHSLVALPIRALVVGQSGWVQDVNFVICGVLFLAYPIGLHLEVRKMRRGVVGPALLVVSGAGLVLAGIFPAVAASSNLTFDNLTFDSLG